MLQDSNEQLVTKNVIYHLPQLPPAARTFAPREPARKLTSGRRELLEPQRPGQGVRAACVVVSREQAKRDCRRRTTSKWRRGARMSGDVTPSGGPGSGGRGRGRSRGRGRGSGRGRGRDDGTVPTAPPPPMAPPTSDDTALRATSSPFIPRSLAPASAASQPARLAPRAPAPDAAGGRGGARAGPAESTGPSEATPASERLRGVAGRNRVLAALRLTEGRNPRRARFVVWSAGGKRARRATRSRSNR